MNKLKQWLANHSISAKTVASAWVFLTGMWYAAPAFHDYVMSAYSALPKGVHGFIAGVVVPALIFWKTQKRTTVMAEISPGETGTTEAVAVAANTSTATIGETSANNPTPPSH